MDALEKILTAKVLKEDADDGWSYREGYAYFQEGCVRSLKVEGNRVKGKVQGREKYDVALWCVGEELRSTCSCYRGREGDFCKHKVALGFAYLNRDIEVPNKATNTFDWEAYVRGRSREELEAIVFEMTPSSPKVVERHQLEALKASPDALLGALQKKLDELLPLFTSDEVDDYYDDEDERMEQEEALEDFLQTLKQLRSKNSFDILYRLTKYGLTKIFKLWAEEAGIWGEPVEQLLELYIETLHAGQGNPEEVLACYVDWEESGSTLLWRKFSDLPRVVIDLWFEKAVVRWRSLPMLKMDDEADWRRAAFEQRLLHFARERNEAELVVGILEHNLSLADNVLTLATEYQQRGTAGKVLPLLCEAHNAFKDDEKVLKALIGEYQRLNQHEDALALAWENYREDRCWGDAQAVLLNTARVAKCEAEVVEQILAYLADDTLPHRDSQRERIKSRIKLLLRYQRVDEAWDLGRGVPLGEELLLKVLEARAKTMPLKAAEVMWDFIQPKLNETGDTAYHSVADLLTRYKKYMTAAQQEDVYRTRIASLKETYKRRPKFLSILAEKRI